MNNEGQTRQALLKDEFSQLTSWEDRYKKVIAMGKTLPKLPDAIYSETYLVKGCQSQVWLHANLDGEGRMQLQADSDALIVKGLVALLLKVYSGLKPKEVLETPPDFINDLGFREHLSPSRANGFLAMVKQIHLYAQAFSLTQNQPQ